MDLGGLHMISLVLSEEARFLDKCDALYDRGSEMSIRWNDPDINIDWGVETPCFPIRMPRRRSRDLADRLPRYKD